MSLFFSFTIFFYFVIDFFNFFDDNVCLNDYSFSLYSYSAIQLCNAIFSYSFALPILIEAIYFFNLLIYRACYPISFSNSQTVNEPSSFCSVRIFILSTNLSLSTFNPSIILLYLKYCYSSVLNSSYLILSSSFYYKFSFSSFLSRTVSFIKLFNCTSNSLILVLFVFLIS